jgi:hypothetical protein
VIPRTCRRADPAAPIRRKAGNGTPAAVPATMTGASPPCAGSAAARAHAGAVPRDITARTLVSWLAGIPRRLGAQLFVMGDAEADWHGWQITSLHGGLGRRYRDPLFATLRLP